MQDSDLGFMPLCFLLGKKKCEASKICTMLHWKSSQIISSLLHQSIHPSSPLQQKSAQPQGAPEGIFMPFVFFNFFCFCCFFLHFCIAGFVAYPPGTTCHQLSAQGSGAPLPGLARLLCPSPMPHGTMASFGLWPRDPARRATLLLACESTLLCPSCPPLWLSSQEFPRDVLSIFHQHRNFSDLV